VVSKPIIAGYPLSVPNLALMPGLDPTMIDGPGVVRRRKAQGKMAFHRMNSLMGTVSSSKFVTSVQQLIILFSVSAATWFHFQCPIDKFAYNYMNSTFFLKKYYTLRSGKASAVQKWL